MSENFPCTGCAPSNEGSILSKRINEIRPTLNEPILPYINLLPTGQYHSEILSVAESCGDSPYIDCVHRLVDADGKSYHVKFRFFSPRDTDALFERMAEYGFHDTLKNALTGLCETVSIEQRSGSTKYVFIASRTLCENVSVSSQKKLGHASLNRNGRTLHQAPSRLEKERQALLSEEEDTEFDDFLTEEDE